MRFLNGVERSSYTVRIFQKIKVKKREWLKLGYGRSMDRYRYCGYGYGSMSTKPTPLKKIFKIMRFLNGVERSSYTVRIF